MSNDDGDDIDLASLDDDELTKQMHDGYLYDGLADDVVEGMTTSTAGGAPTACSPRRSSAGWILSASIFATGSCLSPKC